MTEFMHEHEWTDWQPATAPSRDTVARASRHCTTWMCDTVQIRPVGSPLLDDRTEAAARALFERDNYGNGLVWGDAPVLTRDRYLADARRVLTAADTETPLQDCRSEAGITVSLVDAIIAICRVLAPRDLSQAEDALADLAADEDFSIVCAALGVQPESLGSKRQAGLAEFLAHYLDVRQHTLSTAHLTGSQQLDAEAMYVRGEAEELESAVTVLIEHPATVGYRPELLRGVRHEIADVVLAATALAGMLPGPVTVEACIAEKTEADRGRG
jgi:hypothetical protein